jgi:hypothetical protein
MRNGAATNRQISISVDEAEHAASFWIRGWPILAENQSSYAFEPRFQGQTIEVC